MKDATQRSAQPEYWDLHPKIHQNLVKKTSNYSDGWLTRPYRATHEQYVLYELET